MITAEAATWSNTKYVSIGEASSKGVGGDCSGSTFQIYVAAGFPYDYRRTEDFPTYALKSGHFRELAAGDKPQDGDVLSWHGHMSIYSDILDGGPRPPRRAPRTGAARRR